MKNEEIKTGAGSAKKLLHSSFFIFHSPQDGN
jgi:hypothetical protein